MVLPEDRYPGRQKAAHPGRSQFKIDKPTLDICFVANKYMPSGTARWGQAVNRYSLFCRREFATRT